MRQFTFFNGAPYVVVQISAKQTEGQAIPYLWDGLVQFIEDTGITNFLLLQPAVDNNSESHSLKFAILQVLNALKKEFPAIRVAGSSFLKLDWLEENPESRRLFDVLYPVDVGQSDRMRRFQRAVMETASALICSETVKNFYNSFIVRMAQGRNLPICNIRRGAYADDFSAGPDVRKDPGYRQLLCDIKARLPEAQYELLEDSLRRMANYMQDYFEDYYLRRDVSRAREKQ